MEKVCFRMKETNDTKKTVFNVILFLYCAFAFEGAEDKRGQSVTIGYESHSWLYLSGHPVVCDRYIEVGKFTYRFYDFSILFIRIEIDLFIQPIHKVL